MNNNITLLLISCLFFSACSLRQQPASQTYTITLKGDSIPGIPENSKTIIKLSPVHSIQALNSTKLLYRDNNYNINSYAYSRWTDNPGRLLQNLIQINLQQSRLFQSVLPPSSISNADLLLETQLLDFSHHINSNTSSTGVVSVIFYLINNKTQSVISAKQFTETVPSIRQNAEAAVTALNKASEKIATDVVLWLKKQNPKVTRRLSENSRRREGQTQSP